LISSRFGRSEKCVIYKGKKKIISVLEKLPKTRHDLDSFFIDVPIANVSLKLVVIKLFVIVIIFLSSEVCDDSNCSKWSVC
jgi:hypothetical protein